MQARRQGGAGGKGKSKGRVVHLYSAFSILICSKALYPQRTGSMHIYISGWIFEKVIDSYKPSVPSTPPPPPSQTFQSQALIKMATV